MSFVVDNSVAMGWCFKAERTDALVGLLDRVSVSGAVAPQLWPIEALNALLVAERRRRIDRSKRRELTRFLTQLAIAIDSETVDQLWTDTARLAERHGLTAYDATYLELALRLGLPLATSDVELVAAASVEGVVLLPTA